MKKDDKKALLSLPLWSFWQLRRSPTACECKENLDLVVNHEQNAATTYVGQFNKDIYDTCLDQYKKENNIDGEVLIKVVYQSYEEACIE
jgi:septum formation topological specificity factor MinE